jgi:hypothetical protein
VRACFGVLDHEPDSSVVKQARELTGGTALPIAKGTLLLHSVERYALVFQDLCALIAASPKQRFIFTVGEFNEGERPQLYDLYSRFANATSTVGGETLLCAQTATRAEGAFRLFPSIEYIPLVTGVKTGSAVLHSVLGKLESSLAWYGDKGSGYIDPRRPFDGMTRRTEMDFWYSPAGFLYLAHQAALIRGYKTTSRRIVVYSRLDLNSAQFLKLIFTFEAIGVELAFVYDEDFSEFTRAGHNSLVVLAGKSYFSDDPDIATRISLTQNELTALRGTFTSVPAFMAAFEKLQTQPDPTGWRRKGALAQQMFERFSTHPLAEQQVILETYVERWRTL